MRSLSASLPPGPSWATSLSRCSPTVRSNSLIATRIIARSFIAVRSNWPEGAIHALAPSHPAGHCGIGATACSRGPAGSSAGAPRDAVGSGEAGDVAVARNKGDRGRPEHGGSLYGTDPPLHIQL